MSRPRVIVSGMGVVSSIGGDVASFAEALRSGRSGVTRIAQPPVDIGALIENVDFAARLTPYPAHAAAARRLAGRAPFGAQAAIVAALEAWTQSGLQAGALAPEQIGLVVAGHNLTRAYQHAAHEVFARDPEYLSPRYALHYQDSDHLGLLSALIGVKGEGFICGAASASGAVGIIQASRLIRAGVVDACLAVGALVDLSPMEWQGFHNIGAMGGKRFRDAPQQACRPFDAAHEGFIYGQAAACLVLESQASAARRGAHALCEIAGGAIALHATASADPDADGAARAMTGALRDAGVAAHEIQYVNTHGTSSPLGDRTEIDALENVFAEAFPSVWLNSTKSLAGHTLTAAGTLEAVATIVQMQGDFLHPNLNLVTPISAQARFCGGEAIAAETRVAMSNSFGFGGINASVILRRGDHDV
jgi:malonyl-ACP decarboxylase